MTHPQPLAERLRPVTLDDVVGQDHLFEPGLPLGNARRTGAATSMILWGPPGVGKTSIARALAGSVQAEFIGLSAVNASKSDLTKIVASASSMRARGKRTVLFLDEIHRWTSTQQDALLPHVEDGTLILVGATTENPSFHLQGAINSRARVVHLRPLDDDALERLLQRAETHLNWTLPVTGEGRQLLRDAANGDGRYLIGLVDDLHAANFTGTLTLEHLERILSRRAALHDRAGDGHYDLLSAFHKSCRGSDVDAALYYAGRMLSGGESPEAIYRRLACVASEDVGMADPQAMVQVDAAWRLHDRVGFPEARIMLAQAIVYVVTAPKSNASYRAFDRAIEAASGSGHLPPPLHILNAPTKLMKAMGRKAGYVYDHDAPRAFSGQQFLPDALVDAAFYEPTDRGYEQKVAARVEHWRNLRRERRAGG